MDRWMKRWQENGSIIAMSNVIMLSWLNGEMVFAVSYSWFFWILTRSFGSYFNGYKKWYNENEKMKWYHIKRMIILSKKNIMFHIFMGKTRKNQRKRRARRIVIMKFKKGIKINEAKGLCEWYTDLTE